MSKERNKLFRSTNPDMAQMKNEAKNVDRAVVAWVLGKLGEEESNRNNKALVFGVGNKVINLKKTHTDLFASVGTQKTLFG